MQPQQSQEQVTNSCNVRWSWNKFPQNRVDASRTVVPLGCLFTPLATFDVPQLQYDPLRCGCGAILNPHCSVDHRSKTWGCVICNARNSFPPQYANMSEHQLPRELMARFDTVEYLVAAPPRPATTFALVVDTCVEDEDLEALKEFILYTVSKLPEDSNICLITFGATVQIHELSAAGDFNRSWVLRGTEEVKPDILRKMVPDLQRVVCKLSDVEFTITALIEDIRKDLWPIPKDFRPMRATGAALSAATALLELTSKGTGSIILPFINGVCTEGPGQSAELSRANLIRTHNDLAENAAPAKRYQAALDFYDGLMRRLIQNGHSLCLLVASLDQAGVAEMKNCAQATGGAVICTDLWRRSWIRTSLAHFLSKTEQGALALGLNATLDIMTCPQWKVLGVIGPCIGTGRRSNCVAESEIGMGGTCQWTTSMLDTSTTFSAFFEAATPPPAAQQGAKLAPVRYVQMIVKYQSPAGGDRIRVTTLRHSIQEKTNFQELGQYFDQQAAAVLMARIAVQKTDNTPLFDVLRWLDRHTIRLVSRFGEYTKDQPNTLRLSPQLSLFPAFMFHLRRSAYLAVFNNSPDETAVLRLILLRSNCSDSIVMIQPTLVSYLMNGQPPQPVLLEESSVVSDGILVFDTYFEVLVIRGDTIDAWKKQGYDQQEAYAYFKAFLDSASADAKAIVDNRYLTPRYFEVGLNDPNARIFKNRVNPGRGSQPAGGNYGGKEEELVYTDDAPLQKYLEHLKKLAVQQ
jgi:protein transport protein SEC23